MNQETTGKFLPSTDRKFTGKQKKPGEPGLKKATQQSYQRCAGAVAFGVLTYLKNTGKAAKKATQTRYSTPLMWV